MFIFSLLLVVPPLSTAIFHYIVCTIWNSRNKRGKYNGFWPNKNSSFTAKTLHFRTLISWRKQQICALYEIKISYKTKVLSALQLRLLKLLKYIVGSLVHKLILL